MIMTHTPTNSNFINSELNMKLLSTNTEGLLEPQLALQPSKVALASSSSSKHSFDSSLTDLSLVSTSDHSTASSSAMLFADDSCLLAANSSNKKRVSWDATVEIREYKVIQGDNPSCGGMFPLSLDWEHAEAICRDIDASPERRGAYQKPRRLGVEDRRQRLFGTVEDNLQDFADLDSSLNKLLEGLDDCLAEATTIDSGIPTFSLPTLMAPPPDFGAYFEDAEEDPVFSWERVKC